MNRPTVSSSGMKRTHALAVGQPDEALQRHRQAQQRRHLLAVLAMPQLQRDREAEIGDERERMRRIDRQRRQHREDLFAGNALPARPARPWSARRPVMLSMPSALEQHHAARPGSPAGPPAAGRPRAAIARAAAPGVRPSGLLIAMPSRTWPARPATRTMKNSSRLAAEIDRKRTRSSSG